MTRALVIDDHPVVFQGCRQTISDYGASEVFGALSPLEGFRAYRRLNPDVILLDLSFGPNMFGGFAFIKRCLLYTSPSPRDKRQSRMPSSA